jgi:CheY-like chemotaxis protein
MPNPDNFEVLETLAPWIESRWLPILVLTADDRSASYLRSRSRLG